MGGGGRGKGNRGCKANHFEKSSSITVLLFQRMGRRCMYCSLSQWVL